MSGKTGKTKKEIPKKEYLKTKESGICAVWDFRSNEDYCTHEELLDFVRANSKKFAFQLEKSDGGYIHWQGRFSLIKKRNKSSVMKLFEVRDIKVPNYLEPTAKVNHQDTFFYALKEDTRVGDIYVDEKQKKELHLDKPYLPLQFRDIKLYPYQEYILESRNIFDFRTLNVIVDYGGFKGKSTIASIAEILYGAIDMPIVNDLKELVAVACNICMTADNHQPKLMFFDMPRSFNKNSLNGFYSAIEQIKKGKLYDLRHRYKSFWIDSPSIWVFSNQPPDEDLLSRDRWKLWQIDPNKKLEPFDPDSKYNSPNVDNIITSVPVKLGI